MRMRSFFCCVGPVDDTTRTAYFPAWARLVSLFAAVHISAAAVHVHAPVTHANNLLFDTYQCVCVCAVSFAVLVRLAIRLVQHIFLR